MKNQQPKKQWGENLVLIALAFIVLRTLFALAWDVGTTSTPLPPAQEPSSLIEWWRVFINGLTEPSAWADSIIGVLIGALIPILLSLAKLLIPFAEKLQKYVQAKTEDFIFKINSQIEKWIDYLQQRVEQATTLSQRILERILLFISNLIIQLWAIITAPFKWLIRSIKAPKWYKEKGVVDPGLIEVSLAVTAIAVALPALSTNQLLGYGWLRTISVAIPTAISLSFIDLYAKDKGSKSLFVLLNPFADGPFFFLGWAIVLGSLFAIIVFASSGR